MLAALPKTHHQPLTVRAYDLKSHSLTKVLKVLNKHDSNLGQNEFDQKGHGTSIGEGVRIAEKSNIMRQHCFISIVTLQNHLRG